MTVHQVSTDHHGRPPPGSEDDPGFAELAALSADDPRRRTLRDELVTRHLGLAEHIARRFTGRGESHEDLLQVARLGLVHAVNRFHPGHDTDFVAFAVPTIMGEVRRYFRDATWATHVPRRLKELNLRMRRAVATLSQRDGKAPTPTEIANYLGEDLEEVRQGLMAGNSYRSLSTDRPVRDENTAVPLADTLGEADADLDAIENHEALKPLLRALPDRERTVLNLRFFGNMTQTTIAERLGLSQMHVSRILARTLEHLRTRLNEVP